MNDSVTFFIALGVVFLVLRWLLGQGGAEQQPRAPNARAQRRMHAVRLEHVQAIQAMFPDIPEAAIRADLARTGSPAVTSDNILRNGGTLPLPPSALAGRRAETPSAAPGAAAGRAAGTGGPEAAAATSTGVVLNASQSPLVSRLRIAAGSGADPVPAQPPRVWEADSAKRTEILNRRKEFMLLEARKKYLAKQSPAAAATGGPRED